jgi:hypothetical protein
VPSQKPSTELSAQQWVMCHATRVLPGVAEAYVP